MFSQNLSSAYQISVIRFTPTQSGVIFCNATNSAGTSIGNASIIVSDIASPFLITGYSETQPIVVGDEINLKCSNIIHNYSDSIAWYQNGLPTKYKNNTFDMSTVITTNYSYSMSIHWKSIKKSDSGLYKCEAMHINQKHGFDSREIFLMVADPVPPKILPGDGNDTFEVIHNVNVTFYCEATGLPLPTISWFYVSLQIFELISRKNYSFYFPERSANNFRRRKSKNKNSKSKLANISSIYL